MKTLRILPLLAATVPALAAAQPDILPVKQIGLELARDIAMASVEACRKDGYNVSAVVIDRAGNLQVAMRDSLAARHTLEIAERKAGMAVMSGSDSGEFRAARGDIRPELNHIDGLIVMDGALPIRAAGSLIGAVGVSGAPGGDKDRACAAAALQKVQERLEFAM
ncbi:MAG: heme-binding protein [Thiobacillus sp.]|uniref:GlcG/HbpS family heme-binding protein n=1 Tax=Thiobacillus sp. TaxID=924 RepID=UPI0027366983|nr:heme-binding protein [Thiobacillus sp.]MDP3419985.1 heme-binding protein [Thiobacillus sp.]MDP3585831.1 heme-binding protein [Thiobacillus sp.]